MQLIVASLFNNDKECTLGPTACFRDVFEKLKKGETENPWVALKL